jgi:hypothetical protein
VTHRVAVAVDDAAADDDPFAERLAIMLPRQVGVACKNGSMSCPRPNTGPGSSWNHSGGSLTSSRVGARRTVER